MLNLLKNITTWIDLMNVADQDNPVLTLSRQGFFFSSSVTRVKEKGGLRIPP